MSNDCGCDKTSEGEYLMVKATASNPSTCGTGSQQGGTANCLKQEQMFDYCLSDFLVPIAASGGTNMIVCNASVYCVGMWLEFVGQDVVLEVTNISANTLTLANACDDGLVVEGNKEPGYAVAKNSKFVVAPQPPCLTSEEELDRFQDALAQATELCTPNLGIMSSTAISYPVGVIDSDPSNLGVGKCIKRLYGFLMNAGRPIFSALGNPLDNDASTLANYRAIVKHKTNHGFHQKKNLSETSGLEAGKQYLLGVSNGSEKLMPAYLWYPVDQLLEENVPTGVDVGEVVANSFTKSFDLNAFSATPPETNNLNHYYAIVRLEIKSHNTSDSWRTVEAKLNDKVAGHSVSRQDQDTLTDYNTISMPVKVLKSNNTLELKLNSNGSVKVYYRLYIDAVQY